MRALVRNPRYAAAPVLFALALVACDNFPPEIAIENRTSVPVMILLDDEEPPVEFTAPGAAYRIGLTDDAFPIRVRALRDDGVVVFDRTYSLDDVRGTRYRIAIE